MSSLVSIIIPTYNRGVDLQRALGSVLNQTYTNWEAIVVDNHSTDNTDEVIKNLNDPRIKLFKIHNNGIIAASRNMGIREASGEYSAFLDSDDWWTNDKLEIALKYLESGMDVVYHKMFVVKKNDQKFFSTSTPVRKFTKPVFLDLLVHGNAIGNSSVVVRTKFLKEIGGISEKFELVAAEDYECWLRIAKKTENFCLLPKTLGYYWSGGGNMTNHTRIFRYIEAFNQLYEKDIKDHHLENKIYWTAYALGRVYYIEGNYILAHQELEKLNFAEIPLAMYLKKIFMLLKMKLNKSVIHERKDS